MDVENLDIDTAVDRIREVLAQMRPLHIDPEQEKEFRDLADMLSRHLGAEEVLATLRADLVAAGDEQMLWETAYRAFNFSPEDAADLAKAVDEDY